ncbi:hypothetical protein ACE6ED_23470 [Paenibacillus sp. CN-4]|uniref:hypothetical protein n=1 Tax=Paenibacillus nanchangensis TaxID=3348343 RepID=UPI0039790128
MKKLNFMMIAVMNFLAAAAFGYTVTLSEKSSHQWGYGIVALLFAFSGIANVVLHNKMRWNDSE